MPGIPPIAECGSAIRLGGIDYAGICSSGCLVSFANEPKKILMISVAHGVVRKGAVPGDPVVLAEYPDQVIGRLHTWVTFRHWTPADVALIWVYPSLVSPTVASIGALNGTNPAPSAGTKVRLYRSGSANPSPKVTVPAMNVPMWINGPGWTLHDEIFYQNQIGCEPMFTTFGDSGCAVVDANNRVIGISVAAQQDVKTESGDYVNRTVVAPISAILNNADFKTPLQLVTQIPTEAIAPPL